MGLFENLLEADKKLFYSYIDTYGDGRALPYKNLDYYLRYWNSNKEVFYKAFGNNFIIKKQISLTKRADDIHNEMFDAFYGYDAPTVIGDFIRLYHTTINDIANKIYKANAFEAVDLYWDIMNLVSFATDYSLLFSNVYEGKAITIPAEYTVDNKPFVINTNCKIVKILKKICKAVGVEVKAKKCPVCGQEFNYNLVECPNCKNEKKIIELDGYEMFRQAHSRILNNKKTIGNLCLSIHPMDFITMSDNECGWDSCMSWMNEDGGEYRLGTIEMMNSPNVVVAYLESHKPMNIWGVGEWNNKRWRQLFIVDKTVILGNRQYPYADDELQGLAIEWLREIMTKVQGYGPYPEETCQIRNRCDNLINGTKNIYFTFDTEYMYNDVYDFRLAYVADQYYENNDSYSLCFSGPAICSHCGDIIEYETIDPSSVICNNCAGGWKCELCGEWHRDYEDCNIIDDYKICNYCYEDRTEACEACGEYHIDNNMYHIYLQFVNHNHPDVMNFNYSYYVPLCGYCYSSPSQYEPLFGPMYEIKDMWGNTKKAFDIRNITDEGLERGNLSWSTQQMLKTMRDAKSDEDCVRLIHENAF